MANVVVVISENFLTFGNPLSGHQTSNGTKPGAGEVAKVGIAPREAVVGLQCVQSGFLKPLILVRLLTRWLSRLALVELWPGKCFKML